MIDILLMNKVRNLALRQIAVYEFFASKPRRMTTTIGLGEAVR
jgi:hypothetical protein